jgi:DNA-binding response OmpR family regulator
LLALSFVTGTLGMFLPNIKNGFAPITAADHAPCGLSIGSPMAERILVVDDEPMVRALIARALTDDGYEVVAVANGWAALDAARQAAVGFDLIVTNSYMPGLTGPELIARVREDFPDLPILHVDDVTRRGRIPAVPSDVPTIYKPFSVAALRAAVRGLLQRSRDN